MSKTNLDGGAAIAKIKEMAEGINIAMLATNLSEQPIHMVPMSTKRVDSQGRIWFLSARDSQHNRNIQQHSDVHLIYADPGSMHFLNVYGNASISMDPTVLRELYASTDDAWFDGVGDQNLCAIAVAPHSVFYWDPKSNKLVTLLKLGISAMTGNQPDLMDQGQLRV